MRVCYFGTYRSQYSRNQIMIEGLRRNGVAVIECHEPLWHDIDDRVQVASGGWFSIGFLLRLCRVLFRLLRAYLRIGSYDVMVLGYPGQLDVCLARLLTWIHRKPLVLDVFMSLYLIASERNIVDKSPISGYLLYKIERLAYRLPDLLIQDTSEYMNWFKKTFDISPQRFRLVPTGADDRVFYPRSKTSENEKNFLVIYHGTFIPNHGVEYIVEAANLLRNESGIHFELIGEGPSRKQAEQLVEAYGLQNVSLVGRSRACPDALSRLDFLRCVCVRLVARLFPGRWAQSRISRRHGRSGRRTPFLTLVHAYRRWKDPGKLRSPIDDGREPGYRVHSTVQHHWRSYPLLGASRLASLRRSAGMGPLAT